jgi:hypothetical protein
MQSGKNKLIYAIAIIVVTLFIIGFIVNKYAPFASDKTLEQRYKERLLLGKGDELQEEVTKKIKSFELKDEGTKEITFEALTGLDIEKIFIVDRMIMDYSVPCPEFVNTDLLKDKEYCQYALILDKQGITHYIRGSCNYDLLGFSQSYDTIGFDMAHPIEEFKKGSVFIITRSTIARMEYTIEPKIHFECPIRCQKPEGL